jgi:hypothetical protein
MIHWYNRLQIRVAAKSTLVLLVCNFESYVLSVFKQDELHGKSAFRVLVISNRGLFLALHAF